MDAVGDGPVGGDAVGPLLAPVGERHAGGEHVPVVRGVRQVLQWCRELDRDLAAGCDADGFVAKPVAGLAVGSQEPAPSLPPLAPLFLGELCFRQVMAGVQQPFAATRHMHPPGLTVGPHRL